MKSPSYFRLVTDFLNSLQGFFLLVIFLLHPTNRQQVTNLLRCKPIMTPEEEAEANKSIDNTNVYSLHT